MNFTSFRALALNASWLAAALLLMLSPCHAQAPSAQIYQLVVPYTPLKSGAPVIDVLFDNTVKARMVVDTGSNISGINGSLAAKLGLANGPFVPMPGGGLIVGGKALSVVKVPKMDIGLFHAADSTYAILDDKTMTSITGDDQVSGILGTNFLTALPVMFDFQKLQMAFFSQSLSPDNLKAVGMDGAAAVPLTTPTSLVFVCSVSVANGTRSASAQLQIDTGSPITVLSKSTADQLALTPFGPAMTSHTYSSSNYKFTQALISGLTLGGLPANVSSTYYSTQDTPRETLSPLGLDVLSHYRVLLDFSKKVMYVKPADSPAQAPNLPVNLLPH